MPTRTAAAAARPASRSGRKPGVRELAAQATRDNLLRAATKLFAKHGLSGASVEKISQEAKSYDRMIYYYFGSKEGLFVAVLEETYRRFNEAESALELDHDQPVESLLALVSFVMAYYRKNPEFVTLLNSENLHRGKHIGKSLRANEYSSHAIAVVDRVLKNGVDRGLFRDDIRARDVYLLIASTGYFVQSNRYTLSAFLGEKLDAPDAVAHWEDFVKQVVLRTVCLAVPAPQRPAALPVATA